MPPLTKYNKLITGVKISDEITNPVIKGSYAIGILGDGLNMTKVLSQFTVVQTTVDYTDENGNVDSGIVYTATLNGVEVKVYLVATDDVMGTFPFAGKLIGKIADQEKRLIQMMEEQGNYKYKIIKL